MLKLWIDDDAKTPGMASFRYPPDDSFTIALSTKEAKAIVEEKGFPFELGLDHDLGDSTVLEFLYWLEERFPDKLPPIYTIHSRNPSGAKNNEAFMNSWAKSRT